MKPDSVIQKVVEILHQEKAARWSIQDKGALLAAIKMRLQETKERAKVRGQSQ